MRADFTVFRTAPPADEELAYDRMLEAFGDWAGAGRTYRRAGPRHPDHPLPPGPWRIQEILRRIKAERVCAGFSGRVAHRKAMQWLHDMPGIGLKTALAGAALQLHKPCCPSTPTHRIAQRVPDSAQGPADKQHQLLLAQLLPADMLFIPNTQLLARLRRCFSKFDLRPLPFKGFCNYYLEHHGPATPRGSSRHPAHWDLTWASWHISFLSC
jgi:endonuclease-3